MFENLYKSLLKFVKIISLKSAFSVKVAQLLFIIFFQKTANNKIIYYKINCNQYDNNKNYKKTGLKSIIKRKKAIKIFKIAALPNYKKPSQANITQQFKRF